MTDHIFSADTIGECQHNMFQGFLATQMSNDGKAYYLDIEKLLEMRCLHKAGYENLQETHTKKGMN